MTETKEAEVISKDDIVSAINAATDEVFSTMLGIEISARETLTPQPVASAPASGIISVIGLAGPWAGTGSVACTAEFACKLSSQFLMTDYQFVNEEVLDAVAELTNMIIGNAKTILEQKVGAMGLSTPTVIFGLNFQTRSARTHEWTGVRFRCGEQDLYVQMCLTQNRDASPQKAVRPGFQFPQVLNV